MNRLALLPAMVLSGCMGASQAATPSSARSGANQPPAPAPPTQEKPLSAELAASPTECPISDPAELQLLKALRLRRAELDERERLIGEREEVLAQIEEELMGRVQMTLAEIQGLEREVGLAPGSAPESAQRLQTLVTTLSSLSPRKAAPILARTSTRLAVVLLMRLGPERAGELLARMDPGQAGRLIEHLAGYAIRHPDSPLAGDVAKDNPRR